MIRKWRKNVKQKTKATFSIAVSTEYNVPFKTTEQKLKLTEKLLDRLEIA